MEEDLFGIPEVVYYKNSCPVISLDEYKKDQGQDDFSRKQVWFYVYGDDEIEKEFLDQLKSLIQDRFTEDDIDWDLMTLYPTHRKGGVNSHMESLLKSLSSEVGIEYNQVIERTEDIEQNHELGSTKSKIVNLEGSVDVENVEGKNIILVDNISLSGASILHGANKMMEKGAENVFGLTLGMGPSFPNKETIPRGRKASELIKEGGSPE